MFSGLPVVMGLDLVMGNCMNIIPIFACPISKKVMPKAMLVPKDLQNGKMPICPTHTHHVCKYFFHNIHLTGQRKESNIKCTVIEGSKSVTAYFLNNVEKL